MKTIQTTRLSQTTQDLWRLIAGVGFCVLITAWSLAFLHRHELKQQSFDNAGRQMQMHAETYAKRVTHSMEVAEERLMRLRETLARDGIQEFDRLSRYLTSDNIEARLIDQVARVSKEGRIRHIYRKGELTASVEVSDQAYFTAFRDDPRDRIIVTEPMLDRATGAWLVLFVRPVLLDGKFDGVIFVGIDTVHFANMVNTGNEKGLLVTLLSPDEQIVARSESNQEVRGRHVPLPKVLVLSEAFDFVSPIDQITRSVAVRTVPGWGMRVVAGMDHSVIQEEVDRSAYAVFSPALLLTLLLLPLLFILRRAFSRQQTAELERDGEALRLRSILSSMSEGVVLVDASAKVTFANAAATQQIARLEGENFSTALEAAGLALVTEEGHAFAIADPLSYLCLDAGLEIDDAWLIEKSPDKGVLWTAMHARPLLDENDKISGAVITLVDRTAEHERIADAEMSRNILERMKDAVMITDAQANILAVNAAYLQLSGYEEAELIGQQPNILSAERHDDTFCQAIWQTLTLKKQWSGKVWSRRKDDSEYCAWLTLTALSDKRGRVVRYVAVSRDITEQQAKESDLWQRANYDPLTHLANRRRFTDRLAHTLATSDRHQQCFAVCYLDLDRFKPVNDTFGHSAGDELLRQVAQRMQSTLRKEDLLARIGGDEFALIMPRIASADDAIAAAEKILATINTPFVLEAGTVNIGICLGIARYPMHGATPEILSAAADRALYRAKSEGRNTWRMATEELTDGAAQ